MPACSWLCKCMASNLVSTAPAQQYSMQLHAVGKLQDMYSSTCTCTPAVCSANRSACTAPHEPEYSTAYAHIMSVCICICMYVYVYIHMHMCSSTTVRQLTLRMQRGSTSTAQTAQHHSTTRAQHHSTAAAALSTYRGSHGGGWGWTAMHGTAALQSCRTCIAGQHLSNASAIAL